MHNIATMITASLPTRGYEEQIDGTLPLRFGSEPIMRKPVERIALALIRGYEKEIETFGLCILEPVTIEEIDAAGRATWALTLDAMCDGDDDLRPRAAKPLPPIPSRAELEEMRRFESSVTTDLDRAIYFLTPPSS